MSVLVDHFAAVEEALLSRAQIQAGAGHPLHKGSPREVFIREFLEKHLSERVAIGTGEVISSDSKTGEPRNQHDIVLHRRDFPKLDLGGEISAYLAETVFATIEVKSVLTKDELLGAFKAALGLKLLKRNITTAARAGYIPPAIVSHVVAYAGPAKIETVLGWIPDICDELDLALSPLGASRAERLKVAAPALDGIFVLGKGAVLFDNAPLSMLSDADCAKVSSPWHSVPCDRGSLLQLWGHLTMALSGWSVTKLNPIPYFSTFRTTSCLSYLDLE